MNDHRPDDPVAVVGLAARLPGAADIDRFWGNLAEVRESVVFPTVDELRRAGVPDSDLTDPAYVRAVAEAADLAGFDADLFGFTPRDAAVLDPQIRMFIEVAHAAVECAGHDPYRLDGSVAVYGGVGANDYLHTHVRRRVSGGVSTGAMAVDALSMGDHLTTHLSYRFGFTGPAMTVATACSSSAVAVHLACQALRTGECDVALAGGADILVPTHHGYRYDPGGPLSPDGHCRPFDHQAAGTVFASGAAVVMLKRLDDAIADGDRVWAVMRGSAVNNDGAVKAGFAAPGVQGQAAAVAEAMRMAGVEPGDISYVEAHATGTPVGDPIEVAALTKAYAGLGGAPAQPIVLSSVKGNVGHLGHASGITSLVKVVLCLANEQRAGTANFTVPNPRLSLPDTPFEVTADTTAWPHRPGRPRIAGISSFGIGGTNVHLVVEEGPRFVPTPEPERPQLLVWSGRDDPARLAYQEALVDHLAGRGGSTFADTVAVLQDGRTPHPVRAAAVAASADEAVNVLRDGRVQRGDRATEPRPVTFLFPGQGAQRVRMAAGLYRADPVFTNTMDTCLDLIAAAGVDVRHAWSAGTDVDLRRTVLAQPLLFAVEYALAQMWQSWGVQPTTVVGHSVGELTAAAVAGILELPDAVRVVTARGAAMAEMAPGGMLAVSATPEDVAGLLPPDVVVAVVNGPRRLVVAGPHDRLAEVAGRLPGTATRLLDTSHAFHHPSMAPAAERLVAAIDGITLRPPRIPLVSAVTGEPLGAEATDPKFWAGQLVAPVRFDRALAHLATTGRFLLEVGPGATLTRLAMGDPAVREHSTAVATLGDAGDDERVALSAAAALWTEGHEIDFGTLREHRPVRRVPVPGYPYRRTRHWVDPEPESEPRPPAPGPPTGADEVSPLSTLTWVETPVRGSGAGGQGAFALALLPADAALSRPVVLAVQRAGYRLVIARPGQAYESAGEEFRVRPDNPSDLDRMFETLASRRENPALLVHVLALGDWAAPTSTNAPEQLAMSFHSLCALVQRGARYPGVTGVAVVTDRSADVTGVEPLDPVKATLHGAVRTLALELPELSCRLIDLAGVSGEVVPGLATELAAVDAEPVTALRGRTRWVRVERPFVGDAAPSAPALRQNGVYLLTGGLGGLGMAVAREMAGTGLSPVLVLAGRSGLPPDGPAADRLRERITELETLGATVRVEACDVADRRAVRRLIDTVRAHHDALHGVLHLAGIPGDGLLLLRRRTDSEAVLRPKVAGTLALAEALAGQPLDFFVAFSSRAALGGLVGSADYAAGNAFLDAQVRLLARSGVPALSLNWPSWHTVGMAAQPEPGVESWTCVLGADDTPVVDEHRLGNVPVMPGTGHLDLVLRAYAETISDKRPLRLADVVFQRPLVFTRRRRVTVTFRPTPDGCTFELSSAAEDDRGGPTAHVTGAVSRPDDAPRTSNGTLTALRARLTVPAEESRVGMFTFGPRWDNVVAVTGADDERLLDVALPEPFHDDLRCHRLHPALLDTVTSEAAAFGSGAGYVPFLYERVDVYADLPARFVAHLRRRRASDGAVVADLDLFATDGAALARIEGFTMRAVTAGDDLLSDAKHDEPSTPQEGIAPVDGARLCLSLIGGHQPYQLAVRPHVAGRPVPLPGTPWPAPVAPAPVSPAATGTVQPAAAVPKELPDAVPPAQAGPDATGATVYERLHDIWADIIGVPDLGPDDDFFDIGGDSLTAVEMMRRVHSEFGIRMSVVAIFDHPTVRRLAEALTAEGAH